MRACVLRCGAARLGARKANTGGDAGGTGIISPLPLPGDAGHALRLAAPRRLVRSAAMADPPPLKRPKLEKDDDDDSAYRPRPSANGAARVPPVASAPSSAAASGEPLDDEDEDAMAEEAVVALIAHRERDVERCKLKLLHYQSLVRPLSFSPSLVSFPLSR